MKSLFLIYFSHLDTLRSEKVQNEGVHDSLIDAKVSILVPCYNEEKVIAKTIYYLSQLEYSNFEVIVIDDGSKDQTYEIATEYAKKFEKLSVKVFKKPNAGKAAALNYGIEHSTGDFILCVDADSRLHPKTLQKGMPYFKDKQVGAVAGFVEVANLNNILTRFQQLDYLIGNYHRRAFSYFGVVTVVPGPIGLFRKSALLDVGCYESDNLTFAEDAELSTRLICYGWRICSEDRMIAYTEIPDDVMSFLRQRYRWIRGTFQAVQKNLDKLLFNKNPHLVWLGIYMLLENTVFAIADIGLLIIVVAQLFVSGDIELMSIWMYGLISLELTTAYFACEKRKNIFMWLGLSVFSRVSYSILLTCWRIFCLFEEWIQLRMSWDKLDRIGDFESGVKKL